MCVAGRVRVLTEHQGVEGAFDLDPEGPGLLVPAMTWLTYEAVEAGSVLVVYASKAYEPEDYISDVDAFRAG